MPIDTTITNSQDQDPATNQQAADHTNRPDPGQVAGSVTPEKRKTSPRQTEDPEKVNPSREEPIPPVNLDASGDRDVPDQANTGEPE